MIVESVPQNISCWGAVVFEKWVKQCHENTFLHAKIIFVSWSVRRKSFSWHCFNNFSKTTAPPRVRFQGSFLHIIIFKLSKFSVNLCFLSYKKYIPFNANLHAQDPGQVIQTIVLDYMLGFLIEIHQFIINIVNESINCQ